MGQRESVKRWLYLSKDRTKLCWRGKWGLTGAKTVIPLDKVVGILVGRQSRRFQQMTANSKSFREKYLPWLCCSVVLTHRTVDLTFAADGIAVDWILQLQAECPNKMFAWERAAIVRQIGWLKLRNAITTKGLKTLVKQIKDAARELYQEQLRLARSVWSRVPERIEGREPV